MHDTDVKKLAAEIAQRTFRKTSIFDEYLEDILDAVFEAENHNKLINQRNILIKATAQEMDLPELLEEITMPGRIRAEAYYARQTGFEKRVTPRSTNLTDIQADKIFQAIAEAYSDVDQDDMALLMSCALGDLRHLCDQQGLVFANHNRRGHDIYLAERFIPKTVNNVIPKGSVATSDGEEVSI